MNTLFIVAFISMVIGFILTFIGVIFYEKFVGDASQPWWVWFLIFTGGILAVVGALVTIIMLGRDSDPDDVREITGNRQLLGVESNNLNKEKREMAFQVYNDNQ